MKPLVTLCVFLCLTILLISGCGSTETKSTKGATSNATVAVQSSVPEKQKPIPIETNNIAKDIDLDGVEKTFEVIRVQKGSVMSQYFIFLKDKNRENIIRIAKYFKQTKGPEHSLGIGVHMYIDKNVDVTTNDYLDKKYAVYNYNKNANISVLVIGVKSFKSVYEEINNL
jgi:hypothetical protein